ncbi:MAG: hypothetical protein GY729_11430, partial [Desulfobacteraceae bacterium]|nr:hypothetical protein [Desulfobacteraceae bacterium]
RSVLITDEETKQYYDENKAYFDQPFANEKESIRNLLESRKTEAKLKEWTKELKASAKIHINKKAITQN